MNYKKCEELLTGVLNKKLASVLLKQSGISGETKVSSISVEQVKNLADQIKKFTVKVTATNPFENAQICCGGVDTGEVDAKTMESKLVKDLYIAGELLDVDGICGGYNLQFAWSSGALAGIHAAKGMNKA